MTRIPIHHHPRGGKIHPPKKNHLRPFGSENLRPWRPTFGFPRPPPGLPLTGRCSATRRRTCPPPPWLRVSICGRRTKGRKSKAHRRFGGCTITHHLMRGGGGSGLGFGGTSPFAKRWPVLTRSEWPGGAFPAHPGPLGGGRISNCSQPPLSPSIPIPSHRSPTAPALCQKNTRDNLGGGRGGCRLEGHSITPSSATIVQVFGFGGGRGVRGKDALSPIPRSAPRSG